MGRIYERIDDHLHKWINQQSMFFVGTAPAATDGHVNVSPKGPMGSLRILDDHTVAYLDIVGSGAETIAHIRENGRIVVMFCAFQGPPRILRLHGRGEVVLPGEPRFDELLQAGLPGARGARGAARDHRRARAAGRRLLRLRRAAAGLRGRASAQRLVHREAVAGRRA